MWNLFKHTFVGFLLSARGQARKYDHLCTADLTYATQETLLNGVERDDGSRTALSDDLKIRTALAFGKMALFQYESLSWLRDDSVIPHRSCQSAARCTQQKNAMAQVVDQDHDGQFNLGYTIDQWDDRWTGMLCDVCEEDATTVYDFNRAKGWELLPSFFGLPEWKDLKDVD
jgi:hypothetical protein